MANGREARRVLGSHGGGSASTDVITSRDNRWLKEFRVALRGGVPTAGGAVGLEGVRLVETALSAGCRVEAVLFGENGERYRERLAPLIGRPDTGFPVLRTTDRLFEGLADTEHPQGVAALVVPRTVEVEDLLATPEGTCAPLIVVLAGVQDPGNVGAILRTAAAFGATAAITAATGQSGTASPFAPKALRASAGAALHLPIVSGMALGILLTQLKLRGIRTLASCVEQDRYQTADMAYQRRRASDTNVVPRTTEVEKTVAPWEVDWCEAVTLLVGNEGAGLPDEVVRGADARVHIPMTGQVESLNAAAAVAVVLYEAFRQRTQGKNR